MSGGTLDAILASKRAELAVLGDVTPEPRWRPRGEVASRLARHDAAPLRLLAENKRRSPSAGALSTVLSTGARVVRYAEGGATMVSVLCDAPFFGGSWDDVHEARGALEDAGHEARILAKEFVLDERQLVLAAARGADAVLLIVRIVTPARLAALLTAAHALGLEALVEVATRVELDVALGAGARIVGVNARDLDTLVVDVTRAEAVLAAIPRGVVAAHLSGIRAGDDVRRVAAGRADAALVGEVLMRADDPGPLLGDLARAAAQQRL